MEAGILVVVVVVGGGGGGGGVGVGVGVVVVVVVVVVEQHSVDSNGSRRISGCAECSLVPFLSFLCLYKLNGVPCATETYDAASVQGTSQANCHLDSSGSGEPNEIQVQSMSHAKACVERLYQDGCP